MDLSWIAKLLSLVNAIVRGREQEATHWVHHKAESKRGTVAIWHPCVNRTLPGVMKSLGSATEHTGHGGAASAMLATRPASSYTKYVSAVISFPSLEISISAEFLPLLINLCPEPRWLRKCLNEPRKEITALVHFFLQRETTTYTPLH